VNDVAPSGVIKYYLNEGLFLTLAESTSLVIASLAALSLYIANPMIGHPFALGSFHPTVIELLVVDILYGGFTLLGTRHEYIVAIGLSTEMPLILSELTMNLYGSPVVRLDATYVNTLGYLSLS
jgi:hypothetical protein